MGDSAHAGLLHHAIFFKNFAIRESGKRISANTLRKPARTWRKMPPGHRKHAEISRNCSIRMVVIMNTQPTVKPNKTEKIRLQCELIRSRWDTKTAAERRGRAVALQRELAQQLGLNCTLVQNSDERQRSPQVGAA